MGKGKRMRAGDRGGEGREEKSETDILPVRSPGALSIEAHSVAHMFLQTAAVAEDGLLAENHAGFGANRLLVLTLDLANQFLRALTGELGLELIEQSEHLRERAVK
jgi:hypothetical protein